MATMHKVTGTVMDADGRPAAGVEVRLVARNKGNGPVRRQPGDSPTGDANLGAPRATDLDKGPGDLQPGETVVKSTKTDASGNFLISDVTIGSYQLIAGTGKVAVRMSMAVVSEGDPKPLTMKLPKG